MGLLFTLRFRQRPFITGSLGISMMARGIPRQYKTMYDSDTLIPKRAKTSL